MNCALCARPVHARGYCNTHYGKLNRAGKLPKTNLYVRGTLADKLKSYIVGSNGCWMWQGALNEDGYGHLVHEGRRPAVHRLSYEFYKGEIPEHMCVCHSCDTPACINPDHLFLASHKGNMEDKVSKGRQYKGIEVWSAKINMAIAAKIRVDSRVHREIAAEYGIHTSAISRIKHNKIWADNGHKKGEKK